MTSYTNLTVTIALMVIVLAGVVAQSQSCSIIDAVKVLINNLAGSSVGGGNRVDQGDIVYSIDDTLVILWKRYYGGGRVNVTRNGVIVESWFDKGNNGYAGVTLKYDKLLRGVEVNLSLEIIEANGSIILLLHNGWNTGKGGDYPIDPALVVVIKPTTKKIIVNGVMYSYEGLGKDYNIALKTSNGKATLKLNDVVISTKTTGNYSYITVGALSVMPGEHVKFKLTKLRICAIETNVNAKPYVEFNPPNMVVNNSATITIILPGGVTKTSVVPITTKPITKPQATAKEYTGTVEALTNGTVSKTSREKAIEQEQTSTPTKSLEPTVKAITEPNTSTESTFTKGVAESTVHTMVFYIAVIIALLVIVSAIVFVYRKR